MSPAPNQAKDAGQPGPAPEKKAPAGPVITPQILGIVFGLILVIGVIVYYQMVIVKKNNEIANLEQQRIGKEQQAQTYAKKKGMLPQAKEVNIALRDKLRLIDYLFLYNQDSVIPFFEDTLFPIIESSRLQPNIIEVEEYQFNINMAMKPFNTLPSSMFFENAQDLFPVHYEGEKNGQEVTEPLDTAVNTFLSPYNFVLKDFVGTYEDVQKFIEGVQTRDDDILITVHCLKTTDEPVGIFRSITTWDIAMTVYFMNPEATASGDNPPDPPGSHSC